MGKDQEFLDAARNGNIFFIEKVLNQKTKRSGPLASLRRGPGVNIQDISGYSALHHACLNGHSDIVRMLLSHEASPNLPDSRGSSPLHLAAWAGHQDIVKILLMHPNRPANPNMQTVENDTPLHCAARHGHIGALNALLAHDADPNVRNNRNESPLDLAAQYGRLQAVQMLIRAHPELISPHHNLSYTSHKNPTFTHTCLHLASRNGHKNVVEVLLQAGVNVNIRTTSGTALHEAALCGKESVVRTLLRAGADLTITDAKGRTAFDILNEFPPHVTRGIITLLNNYRNQSDDVSYRSEIDTTPQQQRIYSQPQKRQHNNHYHFNPNNHLLNHSALQSMQYSIGSNKNGVHNSGKSVNSGLLLPFEINDFKYNENMGSSVYSASNSQNDMAISPTSSLSSFEPASVSPRSRSSTGGMGVANNSMAPPKKPPRRNLSISPTHYAQQFCYTSTNYQQSQQHPNPRRALMAPLPPSPEGISHAHQKSEPTRVDRMYASVRDASQARSSDGCEYSGLSRSESTAFGNNLSTSFSSDNLMQQYQCVDPYAEGSVPNSEDGEDRPNSGANSVSAAASGNVPATRTPINLSDADLVNPILKSYNPNRKLKRNREAYSFGDRQRLSVSSSESQQQPREPQSPTRYQQPPTPEHPPPSVNQAERSIYERIRPLSQEYKRRVALGQHSLKQRQSVMIETSTSPPPPGLGGGQKPVSSPTTENGTSVRFEYASYQPGSVSSGISLPNYSPRRHGSSGSLSSSVSYSDYSGSTDYVEEYVGDEPFAGLIRGSSMCLNHVSQAGDHGKGDFQQQGREQSVGLQPQDNQPAAKTPLSDNNNAADPKQQQQPEDGYEEENLTRQQRIKNYLERRNESGSMHDVTAGADPESSLLRPFNEEEAWEKISEIIESFGSGILSEDPHDNVFQSDLFNFDDIDMPVESHELAARLQSAGLLHLERTLFENGYDHCLFMNGVLEDADVEAMSIEAAEGTRLLKLLRSLPTAEFQPYVPPTKGATESPRMGVSTLSDWLRSIELLEYNECFNKHLYNSIESVCGVWDIELQTVLEINKLGHRRRILKSLAYIREQNSVAKTPLAESPEANRMPCNGGVKQQQPANRNLRHPARKNRPAPPPPVVPNNKSAQSALHNLEIRAPSELVMGLPSNLRTKWRHSAIALVNERIEYEVLYLGSTLVKELRGTESTRKSIQKLKRSATAAKAVVAAAKMSSVQTSIDVDNEPRSYSNHQHRHWSAFYPSNNNNPKSAKTNMVPHQPQLVCLSISHRGVEFLEVCSKRTICEHEIQNINYACQDADDLSHFAYITREDHMNFCHVFNVPTVDLATEIILTLGQAFEVAYQLAIRGGGSAPTKVVNGDDEK